MEVAIRAHLFHRRGLRQDGEGQHAAGLPFGHPFHRSPSREYAEARGADAFALKATADWVGQPRKSGKPRRQADGSFAGDRLPHRVRRSGDVDAFDRVYGRRGRHARFEREQHRKHGDGHQGPAAIMSEPGDGPAEGASKRCGGQTERRDQDDAHEALQRKHQQGESAQGTGRKDMRRGTRAGQRCAAVHDIPGRHSDHEGRRHEETPAIGPKRQCRDQHRDDDDRHACQHALQDFGRIHLVVSLLTRFALPARHCAEQCDDDDLEHGKDREQT
ncbi:hypothetical protein V474_02410 [Novosphingobium barchaimii LL02]|uniref:Uncharacterized protein n=1 Tax=Novosphingobium barchaimii LL02 TaxID=1114963 RepID=A0A0J7XJM8_9SPHN|nr:hypothetical protein V474_02410 [Novosphingobium barchaimii LL02]